jgi:hypothetical protein
VRWIVAWVVMLGMVTSCGAYARDATAPSSAAPMVEEGSFGYEFEAPAAPPAAPMPGDGYADGLFLSSAAGPGAERDEFLADAAPGLEPEATTGNAAGGEAVSELVRQPLLIYRATLVLAVFEVKKALDGVEELARELGGYLLRRDDETVTIRVPAAKFDSGLTAAAALGDEVSRHISAEDVSEQYRDLTIRLKNAEVVRDRLQALLAQAKDVKEALLVEEQLGRITGTIEQIKGRLKVLDELIAFSTITVTVQARTTATEKLQRRVTLPFPWLRQLGLSNLLDLESE